MITENYCSYEIAKLLKEKGFDTKCHSHYWAQDKDNLRCYWYEFEENWNCASGSWYSRPTHQMAMAWLREKGFEISISHGFPFINGKQVFKYFWCIVKVCKDYLEYPMDKNELDFKEEINDTYEGAVEEALKYCLTNLV